jgi:hypothetical protein
VKENISVHHNVFARNNERQIRIKYDSRADYVNNVVYGWGWHEGGGAGLDVNSDHSVDPTINVVNNYFRHVSSTGSSESRAIVYSSGIGTSKVFLSGNVVPGGETDSASTSTPMSVPQAAQVTTYPATSLGNTVVPCVGMKFPTSDERNLLAQIATEIGGTAPACGGSGGLTPPGAPANLRIIR